ncbi:hypothetical protein [Kibdelosporangium philippinense]|uniref:hypothetical protein n=1 Tax=Kibdelosporangium philippinense TaxID=211113 RepID=UPI00360CC646
MKITIYDWSTRHGESDNPDDLGALCGQIGLSSTCTVSPVFSGAPSGPLMCGLIHTGRCSCRAGYHWLRLVPLAGARHPDLAAAQGLAQRDQHAQLIGMPSIRPSVPVTACACALPWHPAFVGHHAGHATGLKCPWLCRSGKDQTGRHG